MRRMSHFLPAALLLVGLLCSAAPGQTMHPVFSLLDEQGGNVLKTSRAVSPAKTCGQCHDTGFIINNTTPGHAARTDQQAAPFARLKGEGGTTQADGQSGGMNCFLCHLEQPNNSARLAALTSGQAEWAATATLEGSGIVVKAPNGWQYQRSAFNSVGELLPEKARMVDPRSHHCGYCHGQVHYQATAPLLLQAGQPEQWTTFTTGQVISPQKISASGINLAGKEMLDRSWDIHSERLLDCVSCHFALNNPAHQQADPANQPDHLVYSPRRLDISEYLHRPSHILAGSPVQQIGAGGTIDSPMRRCEGCHDFDKAHPWLPFKARHAQSLACETCHIPQLYAPAAAVIDLSAVEAQITYRGVDGSGDVVHTLVEGYKPVILPRKQGDGRVKLSPYNLITTWETRESGQVRPYAIHHNVAHGEFVVRECSSCHDKNSMLSAAMLVASPRSGGSLELWQESDGVLPTGQLLERADGLYFAADPGAAGFYILGHSKVFWIQWLGGGILLLTLAGIALHAFLRFRANKKHKTSAEQTRLVYMYEAYERYWHWLQAIIIVGLILTGLTIHAPGRFGWLSFAAAVRIHNVLAALLLLNAFLSLFYHFASGKIKTYLPEPSGFFNQMFSQARYYLSGIFKGEPHPFEKSLQKKLNPLQKMTYLVILNILLPLQIVTGILIAGAQAWPEVSQKLGGLGFLVPFHSLLAWLFAAFLILHIYLTTTGHTPLASIKAMISGWEKVPLHPEEK